MRWRSSKPSSHALCRRRRSCERRTKDLLPWSSSPRYGEAPVPLRGPGRCGFRSPETGSSQSSGHRAEREGLDGFSHVEVLFVFDQFSEPDGHLEPRPCRGRPDLPPVGIFAGRGPRRPNRIGVTCCAIESVRGRELTVVGLDAVSGTPVVDLKPVMAEYFRP
ncbi:TrmO family methyltransferase [Streptomyces venezuelae]|uniref:TrmO family methyltransferase domain-containing protein n=1 Tax=Streptomyces venezuelae TaxID=54571 RepID=UPI003427EFFA